MESDLSINEVARRTGLSAHTLRYYERIGLIAPVARAPGGRRRYAASDLDWIGFLLRLRETRMPIGQMQVFARLRGDGNATAAERRRMLEAHLAEVQATIEGLRRSAAALQAKIDHYRDIERALPSSALSPTTTDKEEPHGSGSLHQRPRQAARDRR